MTTRRGSLALYFILVFGITWGIAALLLLLPNQMAISFGPMSAHNPIFFQAVYAPTLSASILTATWGGLSAQQRAEEKMPVQSHRDTDARESSHA